MKKKRFIQVNEFSICCETLKSRLFQIDQKKSELLTDNFLYYGIAGDRKFIQTRQIAFIMIRLIFSLSLTSSYLIIKKNYFASEYVANSGLPPSGLKIFLFSKPESN